MCLRIPTGPSESHNVSCRLCHQAPRVHLTGTKGWEHCHSNCHWRFFTALAFETLISLKIALPRLIQRHFGSAAMNVISKTGHPNQNHPKMLKRNSIRSWKRLKLPILSKTWSAVRPILEENEMSAPPYT